MSEMSELHDMDAWRYLNTLPPKSIDHSVVDHTYGEVVDMSALRRVVRGNIIIFDKLNWHGYYDLSNPKKPTLFAHPTKQYLWIKPSLPKNTTRQLSDPVEVMYVWQYGCYNDAKRGTPMQNGNYCVVRHDLIEGPQLSPMQKPLSLYRWLYELHTEPGSIILDLFAGTGTGHEAGAITERTVYGCESNPRTYEIAKQRLGM